MFPLSSSPAVSVYSTCEVTGVPTPLEKHLLTQASPLRTVTILFARTGRTIARVVPRENRLDLELEQGKLVDDV